MCTSAGGNPVVGKKLFGGRGVSSIGFNVTSGKDICDGLRTLLSGVVDAAGNKLLGPGIAENCEDEDSGSDKFSNA